MSPGASAIPALSGAPHPYSHMDSDHFAALFDGCWSGRWLGVDRTGIVKGNCFRGAVEGIAVQPEAEGKDPPGTLDIPWLS